MAKRKPAKRVSTSQAIEALLARCEKFRERGESSPGHNPNLLAMHHLSIALEAMKDLEFQCRISRLKEHEHGEAA